MIFVDSASFLEPNSPDIIALTNLESHLTVANSKFSVFDYHNLTGKDSDTHIHGLVVPMREGIPFARDVFLENFDNLFNVLDKLYFA